MFNYETCTMEELVQRINSITRQAVKQVSDRYLLAGKLDVVEKLRVGKIKAKIALLEGEI